MPVRCGRWPWTGSANAIGGIGCPIRRPKRRWPGRCTVTGKSRRWWCVSTTARRKWSMASSVWRLPAGNQAEVLQVTRREALNAAEVRGVVDLLLASASREQEEYVLAKPREAVQQAQGTPPRAWDPRLSVAGNRVARRVVGLLDELERLEHWLLHRSRAGLTPSDRGLLSPSFTRLLRDAVVVAELVEDWLKE